MQQYIIPIMFIVALPIGGHCDWGRRMSKSGSRAASSNPIKSTVSTSSIISSLHHTPLASHTARPQSSGKGWVELDGKIDMRPIEEHLQGIPEILHILRNVTDNIESFDKELIMGQVVPLISSVKDSVGSGVEEIHKAINDHFHALHDPIDLTEKQVQQISAFLEHQSQKPVQCELAELEQGFDLFARTIEDMLNHVQEQIATEITKGKEELSKVDENHKILLDIFHALQGPVSKSKGFSNMGDECNLCHKLDTVFNKQKENGNTISQLGHSVSNLSHEIQAVIKGSDGVGSIRKDIQSLMKADDSIKASLGQLAKLIEAQSAKLERQFSQSQKIIIETQYKVAETAKTVQKTASSTEQAVKKIVQEASKAASRSAARNCS